MTFGRFYHEEDSKGSFQGLEPVSCRSTTRLAAFALAMTIWLQAYLGWMTASAVEVYKWIFDLEQNISISTNKDDDADVVNITNWACVRRAE